MQATRSTQPNARPAADTLPLLRVVLARDGSPAASFEFFQPIISFGRAPTADIRLDADNISRLHCTLELRADGLWIRDLGSLNGVYMDGERVQHALVTSKSVVTVGPFRFRARQEAELPASRFPAPPAPAAADEWTRPGFATEPAPRPAQNLRTNTRVDAPVVPASAPVQAPSFTRTPVSAPAPWANPSAPTSPSIERSTRTRTPKAKPVRMGDTCVACHDGLALTWGDGLRCRSCWGDGAAIERVVRVGERCPCCHQGSMLKWKGGLRCRNCGNTGHSTRQAQPATGKFRAGSKCPSCAERPLLTWNGGLRCHGCGQGYR
jgi:hypothetical protein